jgi:nitrogen-specific signal transduction histidine kinase
MEKTMFPMLLLLEPWCQDCNQVHRTIQKLPLNESDRLAKLVPMRFSDDDNGDKVEVSLDNCIKHVPEIAEAFKLKILL